MINWYGFNNVIAPLSFFTLIAGKNGSGKSAMLDAVKYAAYGDTVFNKSTEKKGTRTLSSYTRGLIDATAKTYMRPAEKIPNVYSHIALEYHDDVNRKDFVFGVILETNITNNISTFRYVIDNASLEEIEHTYKEDGKNKPYNGAKFQKRYGVVLMQKEQGIQKFMQMTGLKLDTLQTGIFLRKLRGIMSYDPEAKIDRFIKDSVLEMKSVDFSKLIDAKENINKLNETFDRIKGEIDELNGILVAYDGYESETSRLLIDDIKRVYKSVIELEDDADKMTKAHLLSKNKKAEVEKLLEEIKKDRHNTDIELSEVKASLDQMDCVKPIKSEEERLSNLRMDKKELTNKKQQLEDFQTKVSELIHILYEKSYNVNNKDVLVSLSTKHFTSAEKESAVKGFKDSVSALYEAMVSELADIHKNVKDIEDDILTHTTILEDCRKNRNAYTNIQEYVNLKNEINKEFEQRHINSSAKFACEYVIALTDETWRNSIESFLGIRRYSILVEPEYYDIADDVLNHSNNRYAHIFNTKLLMKRKVDVESDSVVNFLSIKNPIAQKYFDFQLGRIKAVDINEVKNYENAISKEGRVSIGMDCYFLRFDKLKFYYLGQETFELNRIKAEKTIDQLKKVKIEELIKLQKTDYLKNHLRNSMDFFKEYDYSAFQKYQDVCNQIKRSENILEQLKYAQRENKEFNKLRQMQNDLVLRFAAITEKYEENYKEVFKLDSEVNQYLNLIKEKKAELEGAKKEFEEYLLNEYSSAQKAKDAYDRFIFNGKTGIGNIMIPDSRRRAMDKQRQYSSQISELQGSYNGLRKEENKLPTGLDCRKVYENRKTRIWVDDLQEVQQKLKEQTSRYEDVFKNEFILMILKACRKAKEDIKLINSELAKLKFSTKYQFDVHFVEDGSDYAKVIEYAKFLDEREQMGGTNGQMVLSIFNSYNEADEETIEKDIKNIINGIISKNNLDIIESFADYRNYMTYEILINNDSLKNAKLSKQTGYDSGAEVQIPYLLILTSALLMIYNEKTNSTRLVFIDEPFVKMDPCNVKLMLNFLRSQNLQVIFCSPDKTESIGSECGVILPVLKVRQNNMQLGIVQFNEEKQYGRL